MSEGNEEKKIIFVINTLSGGGAERVLAVLCGEIVSRGISVRLCFTGKSPKYLPYQIDPRVKVKDSYGRFLPKGYDGWFGCRINLKRQIKKFKPDIVVAFKPGSILTTLQVCKKIKVPVVMAMRGLAENVDEKSLKELPKFLPGLSGAVYMSQEQQAGYRDLFDFPIDIKEIPDLVGIEFSNIKGIGWTRQADGQLLNISIDFIPFKY